MCQTAKGCHISDVAPDRDLNRKLTAFFQAEMLEASAGYSGIINKVVNESGLMDESADTILALKSIIQEWREFKKK